MSASGRTILVVEDDPSVREMTPALIICDVMMPRVGARHYLSKPFKLHELLERVDELAR